MITLNRKVRFTHPDFSYGGTNYTEYLLGSVGLKVNADIRVEVAWSIENVNMRYLASDDSIERLDGNTFVADGFKQGDTIVIESTASNNMTTTISSISDDGTILYVAGALTDEIVISDIFGETPITSIDFYPNRVENSTEFSTFDLTDRETEPKYFADTISTDAANPTIMTV